MPKHPRQRASSFLDELPTRYKMRGLNVIVVLILLVVSFGIGTVFWPLILNLGLSIPLIFQGRWNAGFFVWTVPHMKASFADTLLFIWGGFYGICYQGVFTDYYNKLVEFRRAWLFEYSPFPKAIEWMPQELERVPLWALLYMLVHLTLAAVTLLFLAGAASFIATTYLGVSLQFSAQILMLMLVSVCAFCYAVQFSDVFAKYICNDTHLQNEIKLARRNIALLAGREFQERKNDEPG